MAGLTQRKNAVIDATSSHSGNHNSKSSTTTTSNRTSSNGTTNDDVVMNSNGTTTETTGTSSSRNNNRNSKVPTAANSKGKSLKDRSQIPYSFYITFGTIIGLQYFGGLYQYTTLQSWYQSIHVSIRQMIELLHYTQTVLLSPPTLTSTTSAAATITTVATTWTEYIFVMTIWCAVIVPLTYVFLIAPYRAGFWTGRKSKRHVFHRYMGLSYLLHYVMAWIEFGTQSTSKTSYLCHIIAVMGTSFFPSSFFIVYFRLLCYPYVAVPTTEPIFLSLFFRQAYCKVLRRTFPSRSYRN
jgi:hypothetical protein